ncbi:MAG: hypothetical protein SF162_00810 [bacterium]|nr:hypothetical protein [bacterium]
MMVTTIHENWNVWPDRGFLLSPDPLTAPADAPGMDAQRRALETITALVDQLPVLVQNPAVLAERCAALPPLDVTNAHTWDGRVCERIVQQLAFLASACVYADFECRRQTIPAALAVPFAALSALVERPPMFSYTSLVLANWRRIDPAGGIEIDNLTALNTFTGRADEIWFALIHVDIEARAAEALRGAVSAITAIRSHDDQAMLASLTAIENGLRAMMKSFRRMRSGCDPDVYYHQIRPFNFGFINVTFEGVFGNAPQNFRGGSGAQSSVIPALIAALGIAHEATDLMVHLNAMRAYMPRAHRAFIDQMRTIGIREYVAAAKNPRLTDAYNACLRAVTLFRQLHMNYAKLYVFERGGPIGTGGTPFMDWLDKLIAETEAHYL